jgi:hypothetical protein
MTYSCTATHFSIWPFGLGLRAVGPAVWGTRLFTWLTYTVFTQCFTQLLIFLKEDPILYCCPFNREILVLIVYTAYWSSLFAWYQSVFNPFLSTNLFHKHVQYSTKSCCSRGLQSQFCHAGSEERQLGLLPHTWSRGHWPERPGRGAPCRIWLYCLLLHMLSWLILSLNF